MKKRCLMLLLPLVVLSCGDGVYKEYEIDLGNKVDSVTVSGVSFSKNEDAKDAYYKFLENFNGFNWEGYNSSSYLKRGNDVVTTSNGYYFSNSVIFYDSVELERDSVKLNRKDYSDYDRDFMSIISGSDKKWVDCKETLGGLIVNFGTEERTPQESKYQFYYQDLLLEGFEATSRFNSRSDDLVIQIGVNGDVVDLNPYYSFTVEVYSNYVHFNVHNSIGVLHTINKNNRLFSENIFYSYLLSSINSKDKSMDQDIYLNTKTGEVDKISYHLVGLDPIIQINDNIELKVQAIKSDKEPGSDIEAFISECESYKK